MDFSKSAVTSQQIKNAKLRHNPLLNIWLGNDVACVFFVHLGPFVSSMWETPKAYWKELVSD